MHGDHIQIIGARENNLEWQVLLHGGDAKVALEWQGGTINSSYEGLVEKFTRLYIKKDVGEMSDRYRAVFQRFVATATCALCHGARLNQAALACEVDGYTIAQLAAMEATDHVIDLGPEAGSQGGHIVFGGTPRQLLAATGPHTAEALRRDSGSRVDGQTDEFWDPC